MAGWEVVETRPLSDWDVVSTEPVKPGSPAAPPVRGLAMPGQIPGVDPTWAAGQTPEQRAHRQRQQQAEQNPIRDKLQGIAEAGLDMVAKTLGGLAGYVGGVATAPLADKPLPEHVGELSYNLTEGVRNFYGQLGLNREPVTATGQALTEGFDSAMLSLPPVAGTFGTLAGPSAGVQPALTAAAPVARRMLEAPVQAVKVAAERALPARRPSPATPGTQGSVGAAGTDAAAVRRARAESLPVPMVLTKGGETRDFAQQQFERETAKSNTRAGELLRDRATQHNAEILANIDALAELTGGKGVDAYDAGSRAVQTLAKGADKAKAKARAAYEAADAAGETAEQVPYASLRGYLEDQTPTTREKLAPVLAMVDEQLRRNDPDGSGYVPVSALEDIRQAIYKNSQPGTPNSVHARELIQRIDRATEGASGELYRQARASWAEYAGTYKNRAAVADLLALKKGGADRRVAFEDVVQRTVYGSARDDLTQLRQTLVSLGDEGKQTWADIQGQTIQALRSEVTAGVARDAKNNPIVQVGKLNKRIESLDKDGKLDVLFGKRGAQHLRDLNAVAQDVLVPVPGSVNASGTSAALLNAIREGLSLQVGQAFGVPALAAKGLKSLVQLRADRKLTARAREALNERDLPVGGIDGRPFEPEAEPATTATPALIEPTRPEPAQAASADPRLLEIARARAAAGDSPETLRVLNAEARRIEREIRAGKSTRTRETEADALERAAGSTFDTKVRQALLKRANELREKVPVGDARELAGVPMPEAPQPRRALPVGEAREITRDQARALSPSRRERDLLRLRDQASEPSVVRELELAIEAERKRAADVRRGREFLQLADLANDAEVRTQLEAKARKLGAEREPIPVPEVRELPQTPQTVRAVEAIKLDAQDQAAWNQLHRFGALDTDAARLIDEALRYDPDGVDRAVAQFDRSPVRFARELARIVEEGKRRAK